MNKRPILISFSVLLAVWAIVALVVHKAILPTPWVVAYYFILDLPHGLGWHILVSSGRILISMVIATAIGVPLGLWIGQNRQWDKYIYPFVYVTYPIPKITLLPIIILFLGIGNVSKIFLIVLILVFQVLVITRDTSAIFPANTSLIAFTGGYPFSIVEVCISSWACLPSTLTSLRLNVAVSIAVLYLAESFATMSGLGYYIMDTWQRLDYKRMYAGVAAMSLIGAVAFIGLSEIENHVCRWTQVGKNKGQG